jgi:hypothetical protein
MEQGDRCTDTVTTLYVRLMQICKQHMISVNRTSRLCKLFKCWCNSDTGTEEPNDSSLQGLVNVLFEQIHS